MRLPLVKTGGCCRGAEIPSFPPRREARVYFRTRRCVSSPRPGQAARQVPCPGSGNNKEKLHETHGKRRKEPHRVHARMRTPRGGHRQGAGEVGVDHLPRAPGPPDRERQALRLLEQALRALRRVPPDAVQRLQRQVAAQERARLLRDVPRLPGGLLPAAEPRALRVQRMRARAQLPAQEALLHRVRRAGQLPRDPRQQPLGRASGRGDDPEDGRGALAVRQERAVRGRRHGPTPTCSNGSGRTPASCRPRPTP